MWIVVAVANNKSLAERIQGVLEREGILVKLGSASLRANQQSRTIEIMVLESEAEISREVLLDNGL